MIDYNQFDLEDFVQDPVFRSWALGAMAVENVSALHHWIAHNPEKAVLIRDAKALVIASQIQEFPGIQPLVEEGISRVLARTTRKQNQLWHKNNWVWRIAAVLVMVLGLGWWLKISEKRNSNNHPAHVKIKSSSEFGNAQPQLITLSDGSRIALEAGSKLWVSENFNQYDRKVYLKGKAFFEIQRNEKKPFFVTAGNLVTKVLGTSFQIEAGEITHSISVSVRTGKVSVFKKQDNASFKKEQQITELIPNQRAIFTKADQKITKTLVSDPVLLNPSLQGKNAFVFKQSPVSVVLGVLQTAYGIPIDYDKDKLGNCNLVASMGDESLFEKLDLICEMIHANYTVKEGRILIKSNGCG